MSDILDTIDGAIEAWETSDDAMRWMPPERRNYAPNPTWNNGFGGPFRIAEVWRDANAVTFRLEVDARALAETLQRLREGMEHLSRQFTEIGSWSITPDPPHETSRERALRLMRERGHGPDVPLDRRRRSL